MYCRQCGNIRPVLFATANQYVYKGAVLQLLREGIRHRRPELWATGKLFLQHGNVRPHAALSVKEFLSVHQIAVLSHAPCHPHLSPCVCFLLPLLTLALTAHRYADSQTIQTAVIIIIIIIFINCNWVVTRWQWLFYMYTKYEIGYY